MLSLDAEAASKRLTLLEPLFHGRCQNTWNHRTSSEFRHAAAVPLRKVLSAATLTSDRPFRLRKQRQHARITTATCQAEYSGVIAATAIKVARTLFFPLAGAKSL